MTLPLTEMLGCEFPLFAFSHCRDVVVAVSRAGGFGVLGGTGFSPSALERELAWIDAHIDGRPYGIDILFPQKQFTTGQVSASDIDALIPAGHRVFVRDLLERYRIPVTQGALERPAVAGTTYADSLLEVAFKHPIRLIANALGVAPPAMLEAGRAHGVAVAALVGSASQAVKQVEAGVDIIVAQGGEAGGHCGEISTLVLVPEVIRATTSIRPVHVLAAGGIVTGGQMAAAMAMGAAGAWTGTVWLATTEAETSEVIREKIIAASSGHSIRSKHRTGKPSRQLKSAWHDEWARPDAPAALPMPVMSGLVEPVFRLIEKAAANGNAGARDLSTYFVGQGIGLIDSVRPAAAVVHQFRNDFADAVGGLLAFAER